MRACCNFIDLHVAVQLSQHHLLRRLFFSHCIVLPPLSEINWLGVWVYFWALFCSIDPFVCFCAVLLF